MRHLNISLDMSRKIVAGLTLILAIPYLILVISYAIGLFVAYAIQNESCPMGFLVLPLFVFPAIFVFWLRSYIGFQFFRNIFSSNKFIKYLIVLCGVEVIFWSWQYLLSRPASVILLYQAILVLSYVSITYLYLRRKKSASQL